MSCQSRSTLVFTVAWLSILALTARGQDAVTSWPQFRGPDGQGHSAARDVPWQWSESTSSGSQGIAWKTPLPGRGWSSPVVDGGFVWLTSALDDGKRLVVLRINAATGVVDRQIPVFADNKPKSIHQKNSHASPSLLIDGDRLFAHFGTYGTACLTRDGDVVWRQKLDYEPQHGPGGSPILYDDLLILNCDGADVQYVAALDKRTGEIRWKTPRAHISEARRNGEKMPGMAFSTPLLYEDDGVPLVLSAGGDHLAAYDARMGQEIWWSAYDGYSVVPRPVVAQGLVFFSSCYDGPVFYAVRLGGQGDVTPTHVAWTLAKGAPHSPSPLAVGDELYVVDDGGVATCLDIGSGKQHWQKRLGGKFSASPLLAGDRIYFTNEEGETIVLAPGREYHELARNQVDGRTLASLAPIDGALFLRTDTHLYRLQN